MPLRSVPSKPSSTSHVVGEHVTYLLTGMRKRGTIVRVYNLEWYLIKDDEDGILAWIHKSCVINERR